MSKVSEFIDAVIKHEDLYDPVKAHEYYLKTRELKGKRSTSELSDSQKEGWAYTKSKVGEQKKAKLTDASEGNKEAVEQLRERATEKREEIADKLRQMMERIQSEGTATREQISQETQAKIDALPKAPEGLNKKQKAEFAAKRREEIAKIRGEAAGKKDDVSLFTKTWRKGEQKRVTDERAQLATDLKGTLDKARETYKQARDQIKSDTEAELDRQYNAIRESA